MHLKSTLSVLSAPALVAGVLVASPPALAATETFGPGYDTWTVPVGVTCVDIVAIGGGGGGGSAASGGGGAVVTVSSFLVTAGDEFELEVGSGGTSESDTFAYGMGGEGTGFNLGTSELIIAGGGGGGGGGATGGAGGDAAFEGGQAGANGQDGGTATSEGGKGATAITGAGGAGGVGTSEDGLDGRVTTDWVASGGDGGGASVTFRKTYGGQGGGGYGGGGGGGLNNDPGTGGGGGAGGSIGPAGTVYATASSGAGAGGAAGNAGADGSLTITYPGASCGGGGGGGGTTSSGPASYEFTYSLPNGDECSAISPVIVVSGTEVTLPGQDANCSQDGAPIAGWTIPGSDRIFPPGAKVDVSSPQQFTAVPFTAELTITYDANVRYVSPDSTELVPCLNAQGINVNTELNAPWVTVTVERNTNFADSPVCAPQGLTFQGWTNEPTTNGIGQAVPGAQTFAGGSPIPQSWNTIGPLAQSDVHLYALWG